MTNKPIARVIAPFARSLFCVASSLKKIGQLPVLSSQDSKPGLQVSNDFIPPSQKIGYLSLQLSISPEIIAGMISFE